MPVYLAMAAAAVLLAGGAYTCSTKGSNDRLSDSQAGVVQQSSSNEAVAATRASAATPAKRCASGPTYALLKRELFRRAAQIRGRDDALFDRLAAAAALRVERPVLRSSDEGLGSIACAASASIDLPPGLGVAGGRTSLTADLDYVLQPAADGSGDVLALSNADAITIPLATLGRSGSVVPSSPAPVPADPLAPQPTAPAPPAPAQPSASPGPIPTVIRGAPRPAAPRPPVIASPRADPSFSCANARSRGEIAICGDPGLAALDRQMAAQYRAAYAAADPGRRAILRSTAHRFYGFRDVCPTDRCIANGYRQRMAEIDDIMQ